MRSVFSFLTLSHVFSSSVSFAACPLHLNDLFFSNSPLETIAKAGLLPDTAGYESLSHFQKIEVLRSFERYLQIVTNEKRAPNTFVELPYLGPKGIVLEVNQRSDQKFVHLRSLYQDTRLSRGGLALCVALSAGPLALYLSYQQLMNNESSALVSLSTLAPGAAYCAHKVIDRDMQRINVLAEVQNLVSEKLDQLGAF